MDHVRTRRAQRALTAAAIVLGLAGCRATDAPPRGGVADAGATTSAEGWTDLFDGRTLAGWTRRGGAAEYRVEDGTIVGETRPNQPNAFLCTDAVFSDFELTFEFRVDAEANSGVQFRSNSRPDYRNGVVHGYQFEIDTTERAWTGGVYEEGRRGWIANLVRNDAARAAFRPGAWNRGRVLAVGNRVRTWLNDVPAADLTDFAPISDRTGFVALQVHGVGARKEPLRVAWRNLRLRPRSTSATE